MNQACFECNRKQVYKIADFLNLDASVRQKLLDMTNQELMHCDMNKTNPEIMGGIFQNITKILNNDNPYQDIKIVYNKLMLSMSNHIEGMIEQSDTPFDEALKLAITGNLIDFAAKHTFNEKMLLNMLEEVDQKKLAIDDSQELKDTLKNAKNLLYIGDNCGEIVLDKLFIRMIQKSYPNIHVIYAVRGKAIVNDVTKEDASMCHMEDVCQVMDNGDSSLGTVLARTKPSFQNTFHQSDVVICKGQGNYEGLFHENHSHMYFLFMAKCDIVAKPLGVETMSIVCMKNR